MNGGQGLARGRIYAYFAAWGLQCGLGHGFGQYKAVCLRPTVNGCGVHALCHFEAQKVERRWQYGAGVCVQGRGASMRPRGPHLA